MEQSLEDQGKLSENEPKAEEGKRKSVFPIFLISGLIHSIAIVILLFVIIAKAQKAKEDIIVTTAIAEIEEEKYDPEEKRAVIKEKVEVEVSTDIQAQPMVTTEEVTDHNETDNNMEVQTSEGTSEGITDSPQVGSGIMGNIGGGGGGGGSFGTRMGGGKKKAVLRGGGNAKTESSVDAALRWLMRHQEKDGHWDGVKYGDGKESGFVLGGDAAMTGLATLAFLAAGHTPRIGKYKNTVKTAIDWLLAHQEADGSFGSKGTHQVYDNAICTLTLAECYAMLPEPKIKAAAQKGLDYLLSIKTDPAIHYGTNADGAPMSMSVMGWLMMACKSSKIAGLKVPDDVFVKYRARLEELTDKDQSGNPVGVAYIAKGGVTKPMTAVGMLIYEYTGSKKFELDGLADSLLKEIPVWGGKTDKFYYWYYGTLAMFQYGGDKWKKWNTALMTTLVDNQRKGGPLDGSLQDTDGSWDPVMHWNTYGRVYTTAMGAFCLEVYYRYESVVR